MNYDKMEAGLEMNVAVARSLGVDLAEIQDHSWTEWGNLEDYPYCRTRRCTRCERWDGECCHYNTAPKTCIPRPAPYSESALFCMDALNKMDGWTIRKSGHYRDRRFDVSVSKDLPNARHAYAMDRKSWKVAACRAMLKVMDSECPARSN
jgi:hypothetical protein